MWKDATVAPNVGEHAVGYAKRVLSALGKKLYRPAIPAGEMERSGLLLDVTGVVSTLTTDLLLDRSLPRTVVGLCRLIHESLALLGRLGLSREQVNAVVAAALDDEMARVDPARGFLDDNGGRPYIMGGSVQDPPGFTPFWVEGMSRKLRQIGLQEEFVD